MLEGMLPNKAAHVARVECAEAPARAIAELIVEMFDPAEAAASAFERDPNLPAWVQQDWIVELYFADEPDHDMVRDLVRQAADERIAEKLVFSRLAEEDWVRASLEGLDPVRAGRFLIHGSHDRHKVGPNDIGLEIEAALAFGTGHHGTTRGCLIMLDRVLKRRRPQAVLDVGTGTGVLALAAARYLREPVAAGDIDPVAVEAARANGRLNGATPWFAPVTAAGVEHPALAGPAPYDLIFANILAKPLKRLAPSLARVATYDAELILSGLLAGDVAGVLSSYAAQGFALAERINLEGWATLLLRRGGAAPRPLFRV